MPARDWRSFGATVEGETPGFGPSPQIRSRHRGPDSAARNTLAIKRKSPERKVRLQTPHSGGSRWAGAHACPAPLPGPGLGR